MSIKYLLPKEGTFYKANLHCHSVNSDGRITPERLKEEYKKRGYSIIAFTEHEYINNQKALSDDSFIAITSYEYAIDEANPRNGCVSKTSHLNFYAMDENCDRHICYDPKYIWCGDKENIIKNIKYVGEKFEKKYTIECKNKIIEEANKNGFLVCYNHSAWSLEDPMDVIKLKGLFAVEIYNNLSELASQNGYTPETIRAFAEAGYDVGCIAADDNHNFYTEDFDSPLCDSCVGATYIKAKEFTYASIMEALSQKNFYASTGGEIYELFLDKSTLHIKCSPSSLLYVFTGGRGTKSVMREADIITEAAIELDPKTTDYIRVMTKTKDGKCAFSKTYFVDFD